MKQDKARKWY